MAIGRPGSGDPVIYRGWDGYRSAFGGAVSGDVRGGQEAVGLSPRPQNPTREGHARSDLVISRDGEPDRTADGAHRDSSITPAYWLDRTVHTHSGKGARAGILGVDAPRPSQKRDNSTPVRAGRGAHGITGEAPASQLPAGRMLWIWWS